MPQVGAQTPLYVEVINNDFLNLFAILGLWDTWVTQDEHNI